VNERLATIRVKAKYFYISLICVHAPTEEKDDGVKDAFYAELERAYERCPAYDIKIVLGDFNAKVGREGIFGPTVGRYSLHETSSSNGLRLIDFAAAHNMVVSSTRFQHDNIHKATWQSPDQSTFNQIDHIVIDGRHASSILDVRSFRGPNIDSDHYLVAAKVRTRIRVVRHARTSMQRKLDIEKLQSQETVNAFSARLSDLLSQSSVDDDIGDMWGHISHSLREAAQDTIGFKRPPQRNQWYDEECREASATKDAAYRRTLQSGATRAKHDVYRAKRREEKRLFRRKKREQERREREEAENSRNRNEARKFYQRVKRLTQGFKPGVSSACRDDDGNLVTDVQSMLSLWREHFSQLLAGDDDNNSAGEQAALVAEDEVEIPPPSHDEVRIAIQRLKNNKAAGADGLPAELFKAGGDELINSMHKLISKIWLVERMPDDWSLSILCPVLKKGDATIRANYRGISLLAIAYKVLSSVVCERLKPYAESLIGPYQCGFRPGKSTTDQIFTLRQILEKAYENQIDTYHLFLDYKAAFDSPKRDCLYAVMSELGIPAKLIRLCSMTLSNTKCSVKVGNDVSEPFGTDRGLRQGDSLSCNLFNFVMESVLRKAGVHLSGTILSNRSVQLLAYADDIDIIGRTKRDVTAAFNAIERESAKVGLAVNEGKTKFMICSSRESQRLGTQLNADTYNFEVVKDFIYLGSAVTSKNDVSLEIKRRITLANRCYFGLSRQLSSRALSRRTKLTLYKTLILPVLLYGAESWTVTQSDAAALGVFERKILRKIFGPIRVGGDYRIRWNDELYELYGDIDIVKRINVSRLRWLGHVVRMEEQAPARRAYDVVMHGNRRRGRPRLRWKDQVLQTVADLGISNWRRKAQNRNAWRAELHQAVTR